MVAILYMLVLTVVRLIIPIGLILLVGTWLERRHATSV